MRVIAQKMMKEYRRYRLKDIISLISLLLMFALSLHMVIPHDHPKDLFGEGTQAAFHGEDKKWWAVLVALAFVLVGASFFGNYSDVAAEPSSSRDASLPEERARTSLDPLKQALRKGILHPKICG